MIARNTLRFVKSLHQKKFRSEEGAFLVEGPKMVQELARSSFVIRLIVATDSWIPAPELLDVPMERVSEKELDMMSGLQTPNKVIAVVDYPPAVRTELPVQGLTLLIDQVQDPGNLGTIIRIADWFGCAAVFCSMDTVDAFNPKVVQASMGSVFRVPVQYGSLTDALIRNASGPKLPVYAAVLNGEDLYGADLAKDALLIMGNESRGMSPMLLPFVSKGLKIPVASTMGERAESLNVAIATGILCAEFRRRFPL